MHCSDTYSTHLSAFHSHHQNNYRIIFLQHSSSVNNLARPHCVNRWALLMKSHHYSTLCGFGMTGVSSRLISDDTGWDRLTWHDRDFYRKCESHLHRGLELHCTNSCDPDRPIRNKCRYCSEIDPILAFYYSSRDTVPLLCIRIRPQGGYLLKGWDHLEGQSHCPIMLLALLWID